MQSFIKQFPSERNIDRLTFTVKFKTASSKFRPYRKDVGQWFVYFYFFVHNNLS